MSDETGSTVPRRQLGRYLRRLRDDAGITVKNAAEALEWSPPKLWRIENGHVSMRALDVEAMCRLYGADQRTTTALMGLARETKSKGWWHAHSDSIPAFFELYVGLEAAASRLRTYEPELIPGLLQTAEYARATVLLGWPGLTEEELERRVAARMMRQRLPTRRLPPPPELEFVINEAVLLRPPGDRAVMARQLRRLVDGTKQPTARIRVLPFSAGMHRAALANGAFTILDFPMNGGRPSEPTTIYGEGLTGALYLDKPVEVARYDEVWESIGKVCLGVEETAALLTKMAEELEEGST